MKTVAGVAAQEAESPPDMTIKMSLGDADLEFPDIGPDPYASAFPSAREDKPDAYDIPKPPPLAKDQPAHDGFIPTTYRKAETRQPLDKSKRPPAPMDDKAPFAPPPQMKPAGGKVRARLNTLDGSAMMRPREAGLMVALPRRAPTDWATLEGFLAHVWRCNKTEAKARLQESRGILLRDVGEEEVADAERFAQQFGIPLLVVRSDSFPNVRQPVNVSSLTINEGGALIMSANKKHHVKWGEAALLMAAALRHGQADGTPLRVFDLICREPLRSYRGWEHIGWYNVAPDARRIRFTDGFDAMLRQMAAFAPHVELGAGIELKGGGEQGTGSEGSGGNAAWTVGAAGKPAPLKLPEFGALKDYNLYLEWHAIQLGSRLRSAE